MKQKNYEVPLEQVRRHRNVVVRDVRDAQGNKMGLEWWSLMTPLKRG